MKIEGQGIPGRLEPPATNRADAVRVYSQHTTPGPLPPQEDTVALSGDAQLAASVRQAASQGPAIRPELVEQARQKLAAGLVGTDPLALAGSLIDHMLDE